MKIVRKLSSSRTERVTKTEEEKSQTEELTKKLVRREKEGERRCLLSGVTLSFLGHPDKLEQRICSDLPQRKMRVKVKRRKRVGGILNLIS